MWSLEEIASNKPLTREESLDWLKDVSKKQRPTCLCLREMETDEPCSINCFVPCDAQEEIIIARLKIKQNNEKNN